LTVSEINGLTFVLSTPALEPVVCKSLTYNAPPMRKPGNACPRPSADSFLKELPLSQQIGHHHDKGLLIRVLAIALVMVSAFSYGQKLPANRADYHKAAAEFRALQLRDENGKIPANAIVNAFQQKVQMAVDSSAWPSTPAAGPNGEIQPLTAGIQPSGWVWLGPGNIGGRIRSILIHPTTPNTMWVGSVCGGVWKTVDAGTSWAPLNDFMANLAIGSMVMDPTDPNTIFAGTGEGFSSVDALRGAGIFKTTNGGTTWTQISSTANSSFYYVNRLAVSPANHLIMIAATGNGIWRSTDGGNTWSQRYSAASILDINFHPTDGNKCIASGSSFGVAGRALYSNDGGATWIAASGVSTSGRIEVAYAPSNPTTVYASANNSSGQIYISTDGGATYTLRNTGNNYLGGQGWYDNVIWVDPTNPNILIVGGIDLWRSTDGGATLTQISQWFSAPNSAHADQHVIVEHPGFNGSGNKTVFFGDDGGIYRAADVYSVSLTSGWTSLNHNLGITEFYGAAGNASSGTVVGGTQDNGTLRYTTAGGPQAWTAMFGGDGGYCAADPTNPNYFYGEYVYLQIHRSANAGVSSSYIFSGIGDAGVPDNGGGDPDGAGPDGDPDAAANFIAPFILDPNNANVMLAGGSNLWRSVNVKAATPTWSNIKPGANGSFISAIAVALGNSSIIWVGHNNGDVYSTANGTAASPTWVRKDLGSPNLPNRMVTRLTIDPNNPNRVYATFGGFNSDNIYRTTDGGTTWANIAGGLPGAPVHSLVVAPFNSNYLYVGTEVGIFASVTGGSSWSAANEGPANVSVEELFWMGSYLHAATHGRGVYKILISVAPSISLAGAAVLSPFCNGVISPGDAVTINLTLTNLVNIPTTNLVATLLATNGVASPGAPQNYGALTGGGSAGTRSFTFTPTGPCGGLVAPVWQLQDGPNNLGTVTATFQMGTPQVALSENFDSVVPPAFPAGWVVSWTGAGSPWGTTSSLSDSAPNSAFAPDPGDISDNNLTSPVLAINTASARLAFRHYYDTEPTYDGGVLEISIGGSAFSDILSAGGSFVDNGYNGLISSSYSNPLAGRSAWSGNSGGFVTTTASLPAAAAGQSVQLRWRLGSDNSVSASGWYVDTITVTDGFACCTNHPPVASNLVAATKQNLAISIPIAKLLAFASDPDGDPVSVSAVSANSANGGTVVITGDVITYTPSASYQGGDNFSFTVSDGRGGNTSASILVQVRSADDISGNMLPPTSIPGGLRISFAGIPGRTYSLQRAPSVSGPWTTLSPVTVDSSGIASYDDTGAPPGSAYYRTAYP
jgi:photosystem II stability/assembly factor-like uncharacterized protein